jgi:hypothetical protein
VADEPKQPWYKSIPGILTAATGLIAALSGLVAGLNQLGAFKREPPAAVVGMTPAPADNTAQDSLASSTPRAKDSSTVGPTATPTAPLRPPAPGAAAPQPPAGGKPSPTPGPTRPAPGTASTRSILVPEGTTIALTVPARTCAPADGARRFSARLAAPLEVNGATAVPAGATAVLRLRRAGDPPAPRVRLDSLVRSGQALAVSSAQVQMPRGSTVGFCLRAGARLTVVLGEAVSVPPS